MARTPTAGPVVIPSCVEMRLIWLCGTRLHTNVLHGQWSGTGAVNAPLAQALFTGIATQFTSSGWSGFVDADSALQAVSVKDLRTANMVEFQSTGAAVPGASAGQSQGAQVAIVVTLRTAFSGRAFRGRAYLGCLADNAIASAFDATAAADTAAAAFMTGVMTVMASNGMPMAIAQRALNAGTDKKGNPLPARAAAVVPVGQAVIVNARLDSQRRRLGR